MASNEAMIVAAVRTPIGSMLGALSAVPAAQLGATCIKALIERTGVPPQAIDEVVMGNVVGAGLGQNPARQATIHAGLPASVALSPLTRSAVPASRPS